MNGDRELMQQALDALERFATDETPDGWFAISAIEALRAQLAQPEQTVSMDEYKRLQELVTSQGIRLMEYESQPEQEPVTLLPDGSAFGVMSFPLPKSHWLYAEREYRDGEYEPVELGKPILTHELRSAVVSAVRYAIRGATDCGKEMDFDPDALVQNAVYALCGPYTASVDAVNMSQERVDETAKREHEWVGLDGEIPGLGLVTEEFYNGMLFAEDYLREKNT